MKTKLTIAILASGLIATGSTTSFGQTNIPTDQDSVVTGTFKAGPTTVIKGENAESSSLSTEVNIAATVRQVVTGVQKTNSSGFVTRKDSFKKYAFGNKEILQLTLSNEKTTGYALAYTNEFVNNPFDSGGFIARSKTNSLPVTLVSLNLYSGKDVYADDIDRKTDWSVVKKYNNDGYVATTADLGFLTSLPIFASYKLTYPKTAVFGAGSNQTTSRYAIISVNGSFSGIVPTAD